MAGVPDRVLAWNERMKLFANFLTAIGLGLIGFSVLRPLVDPAGSPSGVILWWGIAGLALHGVSHYRPGYVRKAAGDDAV